MTITYGLVAEAEGRVIGFCFLREYNPIRGVGPICVDPRVQVGGVGRRLMLAVLERARNRPGVRLVQEAYNMGSLALYASLGFEVKEPLVLVEGRPRSRPPDDIQVRPLEPWDVPTCAALCQRVYGFERAELWEDADHFGPLVAVRGRRVVAYASARALGLAGHGVAETDEDMQALLLGLAALTDRPLSFLVPLRNATFVRWCLAERLRLVKPWTLMAMGEYQQPMGCYFPSVTY